MPRCDGAPASCRGPVALFEYTAGLRGAAAGAFLALVAATRAFLALLFGGFLVFAALAFAALALGLRLVAAAGAFLRLLAALALAALAFLRLVVADLHVALVEVRERERRGIRDRDGPEQRGADGRGERLDEFLRHRWISDQSLGASPLMAVARRRSVG